MLRTIKSVSLFGRNYITAAVDAVKISPNPTKRLITCKKKELNHYTDTRVSSDNFGSIPLASKGWLNRKAKGDFFILEPEPQKIDSESLPLFSEIVSEEMSSILTKNCNIDRPTKFQSKAIPRMSNNEHVLLAAETGCGKTLAYLLPILQNIRTLKEQEGGDSNRRFNTPLALILTPGRELATQIGNVAWQIGRDMNISVKTVLGGHTKKLMMNPTFEDVDVLVGSIGAISKLVTTGIYRMERVRHVVLDEADTLLDDSFNEKLAYFMRRFPFHKNMIQSLSKDIVGTQLILVAATMPINYKTIFQSIVDTSTVKEIKGSNLHKLIRTVPQRFFRINKSDRPSHLLGIVKSELNKNRPVIVFSNRTPAADFVSIVLNETGVDCVNLTGDMIVEVREGRFAKFQSGEVNVLSTTDIGSRGLDTSRAAHVINFDFPIHVADYIHRCGRVGRVGGRDDSLVTNFISSALEINLVQRIEHAARTGNFLQNVDANITNIIKQRMLKSMGQELY